MGFLYPNFLFLLSLATIPIIIHLLTRFRLPRVLFSSLFFLREVKTGRTSWLKLREILLLISRTLLIFFLFLGLSRPFLNIRSPKFIIFDSEPSSIVLIIDDSYSMGYGNNFQQAKERAKAIIARLNKGSEVSILTSSGLLRSLELKSAHWQGFIDSLTVSYDAKDLLSSFERAQTILRRSSYPLKKIYIITDFQKRALEKFLQFSDLKRPDFDSYIIDIDPESQQRPNCGVSAVTLDESGQNLVISAQIKNYANKLESRSVQLSIGAMREERQIELKPFSEAKVVFEKPTEIKGLVQLSEDSLTFDDRRYFIHQIPEKISVLLVGEEKSRYYLNQALSVAPTNFLVSTVNLKEFRSQNLKKFQVVVIAESEQLKSADWNRLLDFLSKGGGLFIAAGQNDDRTMNREFVSIERMDYTHPILQVFKKLDVSFAKIFQFTLPSDLPQAIPLKALKPLANFSDKNPFILEDTTKKLILFTTNFMPEYTDLPFRPIFVPLIHRTVSYLARAQEKREFTIGDTIKLEVETFGPIRIKTPEGEWTQASELIGGRKLVRFEKTTKPGIYEIDKKSFVVNVNPAEGDLEKAKKSDLEKLGFKVVDLTLGQKIDLTRVFLYLAAVFFLIEMVFLLI